MAATSRTCPTAAAAPAERLRLSRTCPIAALVEAFDAVKGARSRWATTVIAGLEVPSCTSPFGEAAYASRLRDFSEQTGRNATFSSICEGDLSPALEAALTTFFAACGRFELI